MCVTFAPVAFECWELLSCFWWACLSAMIWFSKISAVFTPAGAYVHGHVMFEQMIGMSPCTGQVISSCQLS
jgi:hypothetical protein